MNSNAGFIFKVLIASAAISVLIKYGGPTITIAATPLNVSIAVFLPSIVIAIALWLRTWPTKNL